MGILLSIDGNIANNVKGIANAIAKPAIPIAGPEISPIEAASTNNVPINGPVQENDTNANVKAIKNMLIKPVVCSALPSIALDHLDGNLISNAPRNEMPNTTSSTKNMILNRALVANSFNLPAPNITVIANPKIRYITIIATP